METEICTASVADVAVIVGAVQAVVLVLDAVGSAIVRRGRAGAMETGRAGVLVVTGAANTGSARIAPRARRGACAAVAVVAGLTRISAHVVLAAVVAVAEGCSTAASCGLCC